MNIMKRDLLITKGSIYLFTKTNRDYPEATLFEFQVEYTVMHKDIETKYRIPPTKIKKLWNNDWLQIDPQFLYYTGPRGQTVRWYYDIRIDLDLLHPSFTVRTGLERWMSLKGRTSYANTKVDEHDESGFPVIGTDSTNPLQAKLTSQVPIFSNYICPRPDGIDLGKQTKWDPHRLAASLTLSACGFKFRPTLGNNILTFRFPVTNQRVEWRAEPTNIFDYRQSFDFTYIDVGPLKRKPLQIEEVPSWLFDTDDMGFELLG